MTEWLYEAGIGEDRALLIEGGEAVEARVERADSVRVGHVATARLTKHIVPGRRGIVAFEDGAEAVLEPIPEGVTEGQTLIVEIVREAVSEKSRFKLPRARASENDPRRGPTLLERLDAGNVPVTQVAAHGPDRLGAHGWDEIVEAAVSGLFGFAGGTLEIAFTPAMTVTDVDGSLPPRDLALAAAPAVARAIRLFDLQGSIAVDFPTLEAKADRQAVGAAFDAAMTRACERTGVNGFGLMQIVARRERASFAETLLRDRVETEMLVLLRRAERDRGAGALTLIVHPAIGSRLDKRPALIAELARRTGRSVDMRYEPKSSIGGGDIASGGAP